MPSRPSQYLNWTDGSPSKVVQPPSPYSLLGWVAGQAPPFQYMNYLFWPSDQWIQWLDSFTQLIQNAANVEASNSGHTYATGLTVQTQLDELDATLVSLNAAMNLLGFYTEFAVYVNST